jgi:uncharacterized CHY-type Zn-finger protein
MTWAAAITFYKPDGLGMSMALREPESADECVYFTRRGTGKGAVMAWVFRDACPKCKKGLMSKPFNAKAGKFKIRAKIYVCPECGYEVAAEEYLATLHCNIKYCCQFCGFSGEARVPYKKVKFQGVPSVVFECGKCRQKLAIGQLKKEKAKEE